MGKSKLFIIFLTILLMFNILCSYADTYDCVSGSYDSVNDGYILEFPVVNNNDYVEYGYGEPLSKAYAVSLNNVPAKIQYEDGYIYTFLTSMGINFYYTSSDILNGDKFDGQIPNRIGSINNNSNVGGIGYIWHVYNYSEFFDNVLNDIYNISVRDERFIAADSQTVITVCNQNNILIERSPVYMAVITAILSVFSAIGDWFVEIIPTVLSIFWTPGVDGADGSLTIIGALAVASLAIAVILLILRWIVEFFRFRG